MAVIMEIEKTTKIVYDAVDIGNTGLVVIRKTITIDGRSMENREYIVTENAVDAIQESGDINSKWFVEVRENKSMYESNPFDYFSNNVHDNNGLFVAFCSEIHLIYWDEEDRVVVPLSTGNDMDATYTNIRLQTLDEAERFAEKFWSLPRIFKNTHRFTYYKIKDGIIHFDDDRDNFYSMERCIFVPPQHIYERYMGDICFKYRFMLRDYLKENGIEHPSWSHDDDVMLQQCLKNNT